MLNGSGLKSVRAVGKLDNLKRKLNGDGVGATIGIGHTRWATHGRVTEQNAHPLTAGDHEELAIVLNGIIENHAELRKALLADGERFTSDTDAEVVVHLVRREYRGCLIEAVRRAYRRLDGHFAFIAVHRDHPDLLVGARRQCPLIVGMGDGETFLASSITAFSSDTRRIKVVEDGEIVAITAERVQLTTPDGEELDAGSDRRAGGLRDAGEERLRDVHAQGDLRAARRGHQHARGQSRAGEPGPRRARGPELLGVKRLAILACGTAYHAGLVARYAIEAWAGIPCDPDIASEWRYRDPLIDEGTLVIGISQSGETADTLAGLRLARERGARTLAITNSPGSQITREVDAVLYTHAGIEIGVAATKTFTSQVALLPARPAARRAARHAPAGELDGLMAEIRALPHSWRAAWRWRRGPRDRRASPRQAVLPLPRPPRRPSGVSRGRAQAQGDRVHPDGGVRGGRDEARADRPARRADARGLRGDALARDREAGVQPRGGARPRRARHRDRDGRATTRSPRWPTTCSTYRPRTRCCSPSSPSSRSSFSPTTPRSCAASMSTNPATSQRR